MKRVVILSCALLLGLVQAAWAEPLEPTPQAVGSAAEFLLRTTPPNPPAAICLVDTGVNANPDTASVIARYSVYELDGSDKSPTLHGTRLAMALGAARNDWGIVGFWPGLPIVSVQSNEAGQDTFTAGGFLSGMQECLDRTNLHPIKVILVSVASEVPLSALEAEALTDIIAQARARGVNVVVSAGNRSGGPVGTPADVAGALSVGAADAGSGVLCASSATGALLLAPGCSIVSGDPVTGQVTTSQEGTSAAAAFVAAAVASLRSWRPDLAAQDVERIISDSAIVSPAGRHLHLANAFTAIGWQNITLPPAAAPPPVPPATKERLVKPRVSVRLRRGVLTVKAANRPAGARIVAAVYVRTQRGKFRRAARRTRAAATVKIRVKRWSRVTVRFTDPAGVRTESPATTVTRGR